MAKKTERCVKRLVAEAVLAQEENRYGLFTNPYMLGLLRAAQIVKEELG
jgi:hypothetical protein